MAQNGTHALITGSSRGIGRGIALKLAEGGVRVAVHYYQNEAAALDTLAQVRKRGSDGFVVQADVLQPDQITRMFRTVRDRFGKLDIFVSNARPEAPAFFSPPMDITLAQWDTAFDSQAKAFLVGVREAIPLMGTGGRILAITYAEGAVRAASSRGSAWDPPRRRWSRSFGTSRWRSPSAESPSMRSVLAGPRTAS